MTKNHFRIITQVWTSKHVLTPTIKKACEDLGMDWRKLLGAENERFFSGSTSVQNGSKIGSLSAQNAEISALSDIIGSNICACGCGRSMEGKKKGSMYFEKKCRNDARIR